jgi:hypothetical protein
MSSQVLSVADFLPASPLAKGERIEVRGSLILIINVVSLGKGEANIIGMS